MVQGGYDEATSKLEGGFKIMATKRVFSEDECYPAPDEVATVLRREMGIEVVVTSSLDSVQGFDLINVIADETRCDRLVLAIRAGTKGRVFVLDSNYGPVYLAGGKGDSGESLAGDVGPLRDLTSATKEFRIESRTGPPGSRFSARTAPIRSAAGCSTRRPSGPTARGSIRTPTSGSARRADSMSPPPSSTRAKTPPRRTGECSRWSAVGTRPDGLAACDDLRPPSRDRDGDRTLPGGHPDLLRRLPADQLHDPGR